MGVLLGTLHHVEQRLYADRTPARVFHEQCLVGEKPVFQTGGRAVEIRRQQPLQRGLPFGTLAPHARHQLRILHRHYPEVREKQEKVRKYKYVTI